MATLSVERLRFRRCDGRLRRDRKRDESYDMEPLMQHLMQEK